MELRSLLEIYKTAVLQKDIEMYASLFDERVRVFDMWEKWSYDGLSAWTEMAKGWFASLGSDKDVVTFSDIQIEESSDLAVLTAIVKFTAISNEGEELRSLENRMTWVTRKKDKGWKIIHQHTSSPIEFDTMQVVLAR